MTTDVNESKLIAFYREMIQSIGYYADSDAMISWAYPGQEELRPVMIGNKRLVLPTLNHLKNPDWSSRMAFNPMKQNIAGGDSVVMDKIRERATNYMSFCIGYTMATLAELACNEEKHKNLTPEEAKFLKPLMEADRKFVDNLEAIIKSSPETQRNNREFCKFTLTKGRVWDGAKRQRVAGAHFRIYEMMKDSDFNRVVAGVTLRIKDVKMLTALYEFMFPEIADIGYIELGTDQMSAPSMTALMGVYNYVAERVNSITDTLKDCIPALSLIHFPMEWYPSLVDHSELLKDIDALPVLDGNNNKNRVATEQEQSRIAQAAIDANAVLAQQAQQTHHVPQTQISLGVTNTNTSPMQLGQPTYTSPSTTIRPGAVLGAPVAAVKQEPVAPVVNTPLGSGMRIVSMPSVTDQLEKQRRQEAIDAANKLQAEAIERARNPAAFGQALPQGSIMIGNALYVPAPANSSGVVPQGAITHEGKLFVPYATQGQAQPTHMLMPGHAGVAAPGQLNIQAMMASDPRTWPGVDPAVGAMLATNPTMKMQYLQSMMQTQQQAQQVQQQSSPHNQVPRYLQQTLEEDRKAEIDARNAQFGAVFGGGSLGMTAGAVPGLQGGMALSPQQQYLLLQQQQAMLQQQMAMQQGGGMRVPNQYGLYGM